MSGMSSLENPFRACKAAHTYTRVNPLQFDRTYCGVGLAPSMEFSLLCARSPPWRGQTSRATHGHPNTSYPTGDFAEASLPSAPDAPSETEAAGSGSQSHPSGRAPQRAAVLHPLRCAVLPPPPEWREKTAGTCLKWHGGGVRFHPPPRAACRQG